MGRIILTICGAVLALGLVAAQPVPKAAGPDEAAQSRQAARDQSATQTAPPPTERQRESSQDQDEADHERGWLPIADLGAQGLMALFAFAQVILTGVGIHYLKKTLNATEGAVREAGDATEAARLGAIAAQEANALAAQQYRDGFRPWLTVRFEGGYEHQPGAAMDLLLAKARVEVCNVGSMPAIITHVDVGIMGAERNIFTPTDVYEPIAEGETFNFPTVARVGQPWGIGYEVFNEPLLSLEGPPVIRGHVIYEDAIGLRRIHAFAFKGRHWIATDFDRFGGSEHNYDREITD